MITVGAVGENMVARGDGEYIVENVGIVGTVEARE